MKIELIKYQNDEGYQRWKIVNDEKLINAYLSEDEAINCFDKYVARLQEPKIQPEIIKSITI